MPGAAQKQETWPLLSRVSPFQWQVEISLLQLGLLNFCSVPVVKGAALPGFRAVPGEGRN